MIYFDNAATTKPSNTAISAFLEASKSYFNPSANYRPSIELKKQLEKARTSVLSSLHGSGKIIFTSSGTEADNQAIFSSIKPNKSKILISAVEHPAVYAPAMELKQKGFEVELISVDGSGKIIEEDLVEKLKSGDVSLVSIMHVNNETGAINDIQKISTIIKNISPKCLFHSDGVQAVGKIDVDLDKLGVDLYSLSAHKFHALRGVGALYLKNGINIHPYLYGGGQEEGLRSSTENCSGIFALSSALEEAVNDLAQNSIKCGEIKTYIKNNLIQICGDDFVILSPENNPFILSFALRKVRGEVMQHALTKYDIFVGTGSACSSQKALKRIPDALGLKEGFRDGLIRLSFSRENTLEESEYFIKQFNLEYNLLSKYYRG